MFQQDYGAPQLNVYHTGSPVELNVFQPESYTCEHLPVNTLIFGTVSSSGGSMQRHG